MCVCVSGGCYIVLFWPWRSRCSGTHLGRYDGTCVLTRLCVGHSLAHTDALCLLFCLLPHTVLQRFRHADKAPLRQCLRCVRPADLCGRQRRRNHREHLQTVLQSCVSFGASAGCLEGQWRDIVCVCVCASCQGRLQRVVGCRLQWRQLAWGCHMLKMVSPSFCLCAYWRHLAGFGNASLDCAVPVCFLLTLRGSLPLRSVEC